MTSLITRTLPFDTTCARGFTISVPFRVQVCTGVGSPDAVQLSVAVVPTTAVTMVSTAMMTGPTVVIKAIQYEHA